MSIYCKSAKNVVFKGNQFVDCDGPSIGRADGCTFEDNVFCNSSLEIGGGDFAMVNNVFASSPLTIRGGTFVARNITGLRFNEGTAIEVTACGLRVRIGLNALAFLGDMQVSDVKE